MKSPRPPAATLAPLFLLLPVASLLSACAHDPTAARDESRLSGRAGIAVSSAALPPPIRPRPGGDAPPPP